MHAFSDHDLMLGGYGASVLVALAHAAGMARFRRLLDALPQEPAGDARAAFLRRIRWVGLAASLVQTGLLFFLIPLSGKTSSLQRELPLFWFVAMILVQSSRQFQIEKRLRHTQASAREHLIFTARYLIVALVRPILTILLIAYLIIKYIKYVPIFVPAAHPILRAILTLGGIPAIIAATSFVLLLLSPYLIRLMLPSEPLTDPKIIESVERCFARAGLKIPNARLLTLDRFGGHNAMIVGLKTRFAWARPSVFFTRSLFDKLEPAEFEAIILHEVSHVALRHVAKRAALSIATLFFLIIALVLIAKFAAAVIPVSRYNVILGYLAVIGVQTFIMRWLVRYQEMDADSHAVIALGAAPEALAQGLRKLMRLNDMQLDKHDPTTLLNANSGHPVIDARIRELERRVERHRAGLPSDTFWQPLRELARSRARHVAVPLAAALVFAAWRYFGTYRPIHQLVLAAGSRDTSRAGVLLDKGVDINAVDVLSTDKDTPLLAALDDVFTVDWLLKHGANPNRSNGAGVIPLVSAVHRQKVAVVRALLDHDADPNPPNARALTPIEEAAKHGDPLISLMLLKAGARMDKNDDEGAGLLLTALKKDNVAVAAQFIERGAPYKQADPEGWTPLMLAVEGGSIASVKLLLDKGESVNQALPNGRTLLMIGSENVSMTKFLISRGADVNRLSFEGRTALIEAAESDPEVLPVLIAHGAKLDMKDASGQTALGAALEARMYDSAALLRKAGAKDLGRYHSKLGSK